MRGVALTSGRSGCQQVRAQRALAVEVASSFRVDVTMDDDYRRKTTRLARQRAAQMAARANLTVNCAAGRYAEIEQMAERNGDVDALYGIYERYTASGATHQEALAASARWLQKRRLEERAGFMMSWDEFEQLSKSVLF